jgi:LDH2 family malate/lactate/ureidoglycolate dehydrogenase
MALYPGSEKERRIPADTLRKVVAGIFQAHGMSPADAGTLADTLVDADLKGIHSHGVMRVPNYVGRIKGGVDPKGKPRVVKDLGAALVVDGGNNMGQIVGAFAMDQAIERARKTSIAAVAVGNSNHAGGMYYYAAKALAADMIGIATTNAMPTMAPWGGIDKLVGMNPMAVAIPAGEEKPFLLDIAFAMTAVGRVIVFKQKGLTLPEGWACDREGNPTTDPALAIDGLINPIGGHKGYGLAMVTGILSTLLSGAGYGLELGTLEKGANPGKDGQFYMAINIGAFEDLSVFKKRMDGIVREIHASRRAPGFDRICVPGELEMEVSADFLASGIPLNEQTLTDIIKEAASLGVDASALEPAAR